MFDNSTRSDPAKKGYTILISEKEIEKELALIFDAQICEECEHDRSFKNSFKDVETSIDDFLGYLENKVAIPTPIGDNLASTRRKVVVKK